MYSLGVLIGDPASPTFWNLFLADFVLDLDVDGASLVGLIISHLEHTDDMAIVSFTMAGLQRHFVQLFQYCCFNFLAVNAVKSFFMIFGVLPDTRTLPPLLLGNDTVALVEIHTYVGVTFRSTHRNIFAAHYAAKADMAHEAAQSVLAVEVLINTMPPKEGLILFTTCGSSPILS